MSVPIFVFFVAVVLPIAIVGIIAVLIMRILIQRRDSQALSSEERAQLQRLSDSLQRMEDRIGNLETILMDKNRPADPEARR